jgi:Tfp pilus assembly protein PilZ
MLMSDYNWNVTFSAILLWITIKNGALFRRNGAPFVKNGALFVNNGALFMRNGALCSNFVFS